MRTLSMEQLEDLPPDYFSRCITRLSPGTVLQIRDEDGNIIARITPHKMEVKTTLKVETLRLYQMEKAS